MWPGKAGPLTDMRSDTDRQCKHQRYNADNEDRHDAHCGQERLAARLLARLGTEVGKHAGRENFFISNLGEGTGPLQRVSPGFIVGDGAVGAGLVDQVDIQLHIRCGEIAGGDRVRA